MNVPLLRLLPALCLPIVLCTLPSIAQQPAPSEEEAILDLRQIQLRSSSITVEPGRWEVDLSPYYTRALRDGAGTDASTFRSFTLDNVIRLGLAPGIELVGDLPLVHATRETTGATGFEEDAADGIGDAGIGLGFQLVREQGARPAVLLSLAAVFPTGESPYDRDPLYGASTGTGHTRVRGSLDFIRSSDPLVLFWSVGYEYYDSAEGWELDIAPGAALRYGCGVGFSVNRDVALLAELVGAYQLETEVDGETAEGSTAEPISFKAGLTTRMTRNVFVEPFVLMGLTEDAPEVIAGATVVTRGAF